MRIVIPSLRYGDYLAVVLPAWRRFQPTADLTVVTSASDPESQAVARAHGADLCLTDAWTRDGAVLNKAAALDVAFGFVPGHRDAPAFNELCLAIDCDVVPFGVFPPDATIRPDTVYGCPRYHCASPADLEAHRAGRTTRAALRLIAPKTRGRSYVAIENTRPNAIACAERCLGYFQLFRHRRGLRFGSYSTCASYDLAFRKSFARGAALWDCYVLHLGDSDRENWKGRMLAPWPAAAVRQEEAHA